MSRPLNLLSAPLLIGERSAVLSRIRVSHPDKLQFTIDASRPGVDSYKWTTLTLQPFYEIHHARYSCYWYQQTEQGFYDSTMAADERKAEQLQLRTIDFVAPGEQQSEAGHEYNYSSDSGKGNYNGESYRDAKQNGYVEYALFNSQGLQDSLAVMLRFTTADRGRKATLTIDGEQLAYITIPRRVPGSDDRGFFNMEYPIPATLMVDKNGKPKEKFTVRLTASSTTPNPGLYYLRLVKK